MADWEEIKRLAADFQRAQLSSTVQRLSERNCVEIVQRLQHLKLIDVLYTTDGKEYLTPQELSKEIKEELLVHGGRINLVELQQIINVDFSHIEAKVSEIVSADKNLTLVLGQIIDVSYLDSIAEEINDKLQEQGQVTVADLTKTYDLPGDFLSQIVQDRLGTIIQGQRDDYDRNIIFTEAFVARNTARVRGAFSAVTKPVSIMSMMNQFGLQERLAYMVLEDLVGTGRLAGTLSGGRQEKGQYIPDVYTQSQNEWVDSFYKQNGYLEYDALVRLGISDPKAFIKKRFKADSLLYLSTCCVGPLIQDRIQAEVDEALNSVSWTDVMPSLPSIVSANDVNQLLTKCLKSKTGACLFCDSIVASQDFISSLSRPFEDLMQTKAQTDALTNPAFLSVDKSKVTGLEDGGMTKEDRKEQRRKKAAGGGKAGGGSQGRESKTKSTKKKNFRGRDHGDDSDDEGVSTSSNKQDKGRGEVSFLTLQEIEEKLQEREALRDCPEEFTSAIAVQLHRPLTRKYQEVVKSVFLESMGTATSTARKKTHTEMAEKISGLWVNTKLFEKAIKFFPEDTQAHLCKHLLKTVCTDIANLVFSAVAIENVMSLTEENVEVTAETRLKLLGKLPENKTKNLLMKLHGSLNGKDIEDFLQLIEQICGTGELEIPLRKPDKKKERQLVFNHRHALTEQLKAETDPAMTLHLTVVILFTVYTQSMVHAPGRCVPQLIVILKDHIKEDVHQVLVELQDLVVLRMKKQPDDSPEGNNVSEDRLQELVLKVKDIALTARKSGGSKTAAAASENGAD